MQVMDIKKFREETLANGGSSVSLCTGVTSPKVGFFASYKDSEKVIDFLWHSGSSLDKLIYDFIIANREELSKLGYFLGGWVEDYTLVLDISKQFATEAECIKFAKENEQKAYYDAKNDKVIYLK